MEEEPGRSVAGSSELMKLVFALVPIVQPENSVRDAILCARLQGVGDVGRPNPSQVDCYLI